MGVYFVYRDDAGQVDGTGFRVECIEEGSIAIRNYHPSQQFERHAEYRPKAVAKLFHGQRHASTVAEYDGSGSDFLDMCSMRQQLRLPQEVDQTVQQADRGSVVLVPLELEILEPSQGFAKRHVFAESGKMARQTRIAVKKSVVFLVASGKTPEWPEDAENQPTPPPQMVRSA